MTELKGEITLVKAKTVGETDLQVEVVDEEHIGVRTGILDPEDSDYEFQQVMSHEEIEALYHFSKLVQAGGKK